MTSFSRMRVYLAAQVFSLIFIPVDITVKFMSQSVASALKHYEIEGFSETARFCRMFDRAFDALNACAVLTILNLCVEVSEA